MPFWASVFPALLIRRTASGQMDMQVLIEFFACEILLRRRRRGYVLARLQVRRSGYGCGRPSSCGPGAIPVRGRRARAGTLDRTVLRGQLDMFRQRCPALPRQAFLPQVRLDGLPVPIQTPGNRRTGQPSCGMCALSRGAPSCGPDSRGVVGSPPGRKDPGGVWPRQVGSFSNQLLGVSAERRYLKHQADPGARHHVPVGW